VHLKRLLGALAMESFLADYFYHRPYSGTGLATHLTPLGTVDAFASIVTHGDADVMICRRNEPFAGSPPRDVDAMRDLLGQGYTILVKHAERHEARLAEVAASFARDFAADVNIHCYCTPADEYGFGWHYDAEEVFLVQTVGRKEYSLRKNTVNPWPLEETLPRDMKYEREIMPLMRCELAAGDWLYVPSGYWHMGRSRELSISLAIGVMPRTAMDVFDSLRPALLDSIFWRQRLPVAGEATNMTVDGMEAAYAKLFGELGQALAQELANPATARAYLAKLRDQAEPGQV